MARIPKSKTFAAVHETMADLHAVGAIDDDRMRAYDDACLLPEAPAEKALTFEIIKVDDGAWYWRLVAPDGRVIATSAERYRSKKRCIAEIELVRGAAHAAIAA